MEVSVDDISAQSIPVMESSSLDCITATGSHKLDGEGVKRSDLPLEVDVIRKKLRHSNVV